MPFEMPEMNQAPETPEGPSAAPMSNPTEQEGLRSQARQGLQLAIKLLEASMMGLGGVTDPEGKKLLNHINGIAKIAGMGDEKGLNSAQVKMIAAQTGPENAPAGGAPGGAPGGPANPMMMGGPQPRPL